MKSRKFVGHPSWELTVSLDKMKDILFYIPQFILTALYICKVFYCLPESLALGH